MDVDFKDVVVEGKIDDKIYKFLIDSGSSKNYINKSMVDQFSLIPEDCRPVTTIFGDGSKKITNKRIQLEIKFGTSKKYLVEFYLLDNAPVQFLLGSGFLAANDAELSYKERNLKIGDEILGFFNAKKTVEEELEERLLYNVNSESTKETSRITRWKLNMNEFDYDLFHIDGKENCIEDRLSRCFIGRTSINQEREEEYLQLLNKASKFNEGEYELDSRNRIIIRGNRCEALLKRLHIYLW